MDSKIIINLRPAACFALSLLVMTPAWAAERQSLRGHVPTAVARSRPVGRLPDSSRLNLVIGLPLRNQEALTTLLDQLYNPASPQYRRYLTPEQFAEKFGPEKQDYEALIAFAKSQGLAVTATHPNRTLLDVSGSVEDIGRAFHVGLRVYQHPTEARTFHAPDVEPSLDLPNRVLHISGLDNLSRPRPMGHRMKSDGSKLGPARGGSGPGGGFLGNDFRAAYLPGVALTGTGQSVALIEFDGYFASDIRDYESLAGLPNVPLQNVLIGGFDGTPGADNAEAALDIEMAISMAPGLSKVIIYQARNDPAVVNDVLNRIATDNLARQISCSWYGFDQQTSTDQIFQQYAAQGQSFFQVSGDFDAYPIPSMGFPNGVAPPTDNPYVTIVGGTELNTSGPGRAWVSETVWNLGYYPGLGYSVGSSGGVSPTYSLPSWQQGLSMTANHGSTVRRNFPDVAMVADNIWLFANNGDSWASWGTSASAPLWAGFTALANQLAETHGQPPVGFINPAIYALGQGASYSSAFHDITIGNNNSSSSQTGFPAVPGYDLCTGWGTPNGSNLLQALALPQLFQITPEINLAASGGVGGPFYGSFGFDTSSSTYALTNSAASALGWTLAYDAAWLDASASSGTLAPGGGGATVTLSLNSQANSLPLGSYTANVWFTNLNDGSVQSRLFTLAVITPPMIISQLVDQSLPEGGTATFTVVVAASSLPVRYQWTRNGIILTDNGHISGATTSTLTISDVSAADVGTYHVFVFNTVGVLSSMAPMLTVASPPVIVAQPADQIVLPGETAMFAVGAVGTPPLAFQWRNNGTNLASGGGSRILTLHNVTPANAGAYSVVVSNALGTVTNAESMLAVIQVTPPGVTLATLYSFTNGNDGANPNGLIQATNGHLYGTANSGGANRAGTVFRITTNGALTTLHAFSGGSGGASPRAALIQAADGNFYGTTYSGGANFGGTAFKMSVNGALTTLHAFNFVSDGGYPAARLVQATDGNFYGTASIAGGSGNGTVFKMTPSGAVTPLHGFSGADGANPRAGLIQGGDGKLYGTTKSGGANPYDGTVFKITTTGTLSTLFRFNGTNSFSPRAALVQGRDGNFYGTTFNGGAHGRGTVFRITSAGLLTTLHSFNGGGDGQWPISALVQGQDGYFYGTTSYGGSGFNGSEFSGEGTVFRMTPSGQLTTLVYFDAFNGANPSAPLVQATDGSFYGTTLNGGENGAGTVFRLNVPAASLSIALSDSQVVLSWPSWITDLVLQQNSDLTTSNWTAVTASPVVTNLQNQITLLPALSGNTFYRLAR